jgi:hypothetical protein
MTAQMHFTPNVQDSTNFKEYFLKYDSLQHVSQELAFSVFNRYMCKAGCKMCYLQDVWMEDDQFQSYVPKEITSETEQSILKFFEGFYEVGTYDDLSYLKKKYPHLYEFYKRNSHLMINTSMTDTAFIQQYPLLMEELSFKGIYEITFSDVFLQKKNGGLAHDIVGMLKPLHAKMPISKLKIIRLTSDGENSDAVKAIVNYAHEIGITVGLQDDIIKGQNDTLSLDVADYQELNYFAQGSEPMQVLSEITYLQFTSCFMTLNQTVDPEAVPFFDIITDGYNNYEKYIIASLDAKLKMYNRYTQIMDNTCGNKLFDYFAYATTSVTINKQFNFIPAIILKPWTTIYKKLATTGEWLETPHGLLKKNALHSLVVPLFSISVKPKQKIYHIPIKCVSV